VYIILTKDTMGFFSGKDTLLYKDNIYWTEGILLYIDRTKSFSSYRGAISNRDLRANSKPIVGKLMDLLFK
jgi:hypothetical protein